jgi:hypothetical protein
VFSSLQETAVKLYESIERPLRGENNYEKPYDLSLEHTAATLTVKPLTKSYLKQFIFSVTYEWAV